MIADFEKQTAIPKEELLIAKKVITAFKECEDAEEWYAMPFSIWARLEELQDMLERMTK